MLPQEGTKDICFWLRVSIFVFFRELFLGKHATRSAVLKKLYTLFSACFVEYVLFFSEHVTPLPWLKTLAPEFENVLRAGASNMGQQIRVELNQRYRAFLEQQPDTDRHVLTTDEVQALLLEVNPVSRTLYERVVRSFKMSHAARGTGPPRPAARRASNRNKEVAGAQAFDPDALDLVPYTNNFCLFEKLCLRRDVSEDAVAPLWVYTNTVRVYEGTAEMLQKQIARCEEMGITSSALLKQASTLFLCLRCLHGGNLSKFRSDLRSGETSCCTCNSSDLCVQVCLCLCARVCVCVFLFCLCVLSFSFIAYQKQVCLLGRIAYINDVPLIICPHCSRFVVYDGLGCVHHVGTRGCCHREWSKHVLSNSFQRQFLRASFMHTLGQGQQDEDSQLAVSREYVQQRVRGETAAVLAVDDTQPRKACAMCRASHIHTTYSLLDVYSRRVVHVNVCTKHALYGRFAGINLVTLQQFLSISGFIEKSRSTHAHDVFAAGRV